MNEQKSNWKYLLDWMGEHPMLTFVVVAMICSAMDGGCR